MKKRNRNLSEPLVRTATYISGGKAYEFPKNGVGRAWYETGELHYTENFKNFMRHGERTAYYPDGTIKEKTSFKYGHRYGLCQIFYPTGILKSETIYDNDFPESRKEFYPSGCLSCIKEFTRGQPPKCQYFQDVYKEHKCI